MIYNKDTINKLYIKLYNEKIDIDNLTNNLCKIYGYKLSLIIQLFPKTENRSNWPFKNKFQQLFSNFIIWILGLDNEKRYKKTYKFIHDIHFKKNYRILKKILNSIS